MGDPPSLYLGEIRERMRGFLRARLVLEVSPLRTRALEKGAFVMKCSGGYFFGLPDVFPDKNCVSLACSLG